MAYVLAHHFDPDFDHTRLRPRETENGSVDHYNLGYVQNVVVTQVLAEFKPLDPAHEDRNDPRFIVEEKEFPAGPGTRVNPENPDQLLAASNGYVFYNENGLITVKKTLNIRRDVDFHTGNILFVGDVVVHGAVRSSFAVEGRNVLVKGVIGGASVTAQGSIVAEGGVKGAHEGVLMAEKSVKAAFCENAEITAGENILIDGPAMHSTLYAGRQIAVRGRLQGGDVFCKGVVHVADQLGGGAGSVTSVHLGYDPALLQQAERLELLLEETVQTVRELKAQYKRYPEMAGEFGPKLERQQKRRDAIERQLAAARDKLTRTAKPERSSLVVAGAVKPGVNVTICEAELQVGEIMENVHFSYRDGEIVFNAPARQGMQQD